MQKICLAGYSGHAFVVAEIVSLLNYTLIGYLDIEEKTNNPFGLKYLGNEIEVDLSQFVDQNIHIALGTGDNKMRKRLGEIFEKNKIPVKTLKHPAASVSSLSSLGEGVIVMSSAIINPFVKIGKGVICNSGCIIEHECVVGDYAHIAPGAILAGNVLVGENSFIGSNSVIKQGTKIGENVIIGAGSVVLNDVPDNAIAYGNPARIKNQ